MLSKTIQDAVNDQIRKEFASAYLYLAMSAHCEAVNLPGCAHWMRLQSQEEAGHAMKFFDYVSARGGRVTLQAIDQPLARVKSPLDMFQQTLEGERKVTEFIHQLYALAVKENDYPTQTMLQWFVTEQVEEEKTTAQIVEQWKLVGENGPALLLLDRQLGARAAG
jgi:ferritin